MDIEGLFFELLQVAIGNRKSLSVTPSAEQWTELFALSKKQALVGIAFYGVSCLKEQNPDDDGFCSSIGMPEAVYLQWMGLMVKTVQRNKDMNKECVRLVKQLTHDGFHCCILKGQSNLVYYPGDLRECRTAGDIDVLFRPMASSAQVGEQGRITTSKNALDISIRYCQERALLLGRKRPHVTYHHADLVWEGTTEVEGHYRATFLCSPLRNRRLQKWLEGNMPFLGDDVAVGEHVRVQAEGHVGCPMNIPIPPVSYNVIYQLLHIYKHLFEEGIGLRQLLDYYFVLRALHIEQESLSPALPKREGEKPDHWQSMAQWAEGMGVAVKSNEEIMHTLGRFGMKKFAGAVMYVLQTVFEAPLNPPEGGKLENTNWQTKYPWMICEPNEKEGKFLLNEIMKAGNFGKYDERIKHGGTKSQHAWEKTKHNLRLLTHYPEEVICEPFFRIYHFLWRKLELWKF